MGTDQGEHKKKGNQSEPTLMALRIKNRTLTSNKQQKPRQLVILKKSACSSQGKVARGFHLCAFAKVRALAKESDIRRLRLIASCIQVISGAMSVHAEQLRLQVSWLEVVRRWLGWQVVRLPDGLDWSGSGPVSLLIITTQGIWRLDRNIADLWEGAGYGAGKGLGSWCSSFGWRVAEMWVRLPWIE